MREDVDLDYDENFIRIEPPVIKGRTPVILIHDIKTVKLYIFNMTMLYELSHLFSFDVAAK